MSFHLCSTSLPKQTEILDLKQYHISYRVPHDKSGSSPEGCHRWDKPLTSFLCPPALFESFLMDFLSDPCMLCCFHTGVSLSEEGRIPSLQSSCDFCSSRKLVQPKQCLCDHGRSQAEIQLPPFQEHSATSMNGRAPAICVALHFNPVCELISLQAGKC